MTRPPEERLLTEANAALLYAPLEDLPLLPLFASASRPDPVTAGPGAQVYDTDLSKPIVSDGTVWRDYTGTAV
jgi:hypothetical protein